MRSVSRSRGVTSEEMTAAGVATVASTGRLIDRFRDRVMFPIIHNREILGFVGRRHPDLTDTDRGGPKYLNTADTPLFHKGAQLFGANEVDIAAGGMRSPPAGRRGLGRTDPGSGWGRVG
jgi:DNA primase